MPGWYWAFVFYSLLSTPALVFILLLLVGDVRWLAALRSIPDAGAAGELALEQQGARFRGELVGDPTTSTPLGRPAVAWIGVVERTARHGKRSTTTERCRLGSLARLRLATERGTLAVASPDPSDVDLDTGVPKRETRRPRYRFQTVTSLSTIPDAVVERCQLDRQALTTDRWTYVERVAAPGSIAEIAGCAGGGSSIVSCPAGVAGGHLSVGGMQPLLRELARRTMLEAAGLTVVMLFSSAVGATGAALALRRAAKTAPAQP